jgi:hypothetical protein
MPAKNKKRVSCIIVDYLYICRRKEKMRRGRAVPSLLFRYTKT